MDPTVTNQNQIPQKKLSLLKIVILIFAGIIAFEILMGLKTLLTPIPASLPKTAAITAGTITLSAPQTIKTGNSVPVNIKISTGNHLTTGVDLVLKYDAQKLEASPGSFIKGNAYDDYPPLNIDSANGIIRISGVVSVNKEGFKGSGDFGTLQFLAKSSGSTSVSLDFKPGQTSDSNMLEVGTNNDVLGQVESATIKIE